jgi:hypothetical protein
VPGTHRKEARGQSQKTSRLRFRSSRRIQLIFRLVLTGCLNNNNNNKHNSPHIAANPYLTHSIRSANHFLHIVVNPFASILLKVDLFRQTTIDRLPLPFLVHQSTAPTTSSLPYPRSPILPTTSSRHHSALLQCLRLPIGPPRWIGHLRSTSGSLPSMT